MKLEESPLPLWGLPFIYIAMYRDGTTEGYNPPQRECGDSSTSFCILQWVCQYLVFVPILISRTPTQTTKCGSKSTVHQLVNFKSAHLHCQDVIQTIIALLFHIQCDATEINRCAISEVFSPLSMVLSGQYLFAEILYGLKNPLSPCTICEINF